MVLIVGGGASGMTAAIAAARSGAQVTLLERLERVGKKLLATGNGRCNLANLRLDPSRFHGRDPSFPQPVLAAFGVNRTLAFFEELGITPREEEEGKVFPRSGQASAVLDVLRHEMGRLGVAVRCGTRVTGARREGTGFALRLAGGEDLAGERLVLACGGRAAPTLGSDGSGYDLARALGHRLVEPFPALTRVRLDAPYLKGLAGLKVEAAATLLRDGEVVRREAGEVLFTAEGASGPPILQLSRGAGEALRDKAKPALELDLFPDTDAGRLVELLRRRLLREDRDPPFALVGLLHKRLIPAALREAGVSALLERSDGPEAAARLASLLKGWRFGVTGTGPWADAQVTAGGVDTADVDSRTLESRLAPGLFLAGELLDVDGDCGGFNLQWAWSSGWTAGTGAAAG